MKFYKKISNKIAILLTAVIVMSTLVLPVGVFAVNPANLTGYSVTFNQRFVTVSGTIETTRQNEDVIITVLKKDATEDDFNSQPLGNVNEYIKYFDHTRLNNSDEFSFTFKLNGESGDYVVLIDSKAMDGTYSETFTFTNTLWSELNGLKASGTLGDFRAFIEAEWASLGIELAEYNTLSADEKNAVCTSLKGFAENYDVDKFNAEWYKTVCWAYAAKNKSNVAKVIAMFADKNAKEVSLFSSEWLTYVLETYPESSRTKLFENALNDETCIDLASLMTLMQDKLVISYVQAAGYWNDFYLILSADMGFNPTDISTFNTLSNKDAVVEAMYIQSRNLTTSAQVISLFGTLVTAQKTAESTPARPTQRPTQRPSGGGGGGSWSVGIPSVTPIVTPEPSETPGTVSPETSEPPKTSETVFNDISDVEWAKEAIEYLAEKEILSGTGEGNFEPNRYITREELVKILDNAFKYSEEAVESDFSDVDKSAWYYASVSAAAAKGIVLGYEDGSFGIGKFVTREDAAVIVFRAAGTENFGSDAELKFRDNAEISDYAKDAVALLSGNGIISGMDNGSFMPKSQLTRAQAAKLFYELLMYIQ